MSHEIFRWCEEDARLVEEEAARVAANGRNFLAVEDALTELDVYLSGLPVREHQAAIEGIREYAEAVGKEFEIERGWHLRWNGDV